MDFTVLFTEAVTVNTSGGTPYIPITLHTGGTVNASYVSGSNSTELKFRYTVVAGNLDPDGISIGSAITAGANYNNSYANDTTITISGTLNTGDVVINTTTTGQGWNLIGNPYTSTADWSSGITRNNVYNAGFLC
jgi:hypothetical protein